MDLHTRSEGVDDIAAFEREALARIGGMPQEIALRHRLPHFDHLFGSDSYSAGYYSYLWSDVMAADAWQAFVEAGGHGTQARTSACERTSFRTAMSSIAPRPIAVSAAATRTCKRFSTRVGLPTPLHLPVLPTRPPLPPLPPLPIDAHIGSVREALARQRAVVLSASPGAGKTTRSSAGADRRRPRHPAAAPACCRPRCGAADRRGAGMVARARNRLADSV